jgi:hypothetical protein
MRFEGLKVTFGERVAQGVKRAKKGIFASFYLEG